VVVQPPPLSFVRSADLGQQAIRRCTTKEGGLGQLEERMPRSRISDVLSAHPVDLRASIFCIDWHSDRTIVVQGQT